MSLRVSLACVVLLFATIQVNAAPPATRPTQGHVTSSVDGKPIAGATVWVVREPSFEKPQVLLKTTTRADGSYDVPAMPAPTDDSPISIIARADGFGLCGALRGFDVAMPAVATIHVKLMQPDGKPAVGVSVAPGQLFGANSNNDLGLSWVVLVPDELIDGFAVTSDAQGFATLPGMPRNASVTLHVVDDTYAQFDYRQAITVPKTGDVKSASIQLIASGSIEGSVLDANGKPVPDVYVGAQGTAASAPDGGAAYTDDAGRYVLKQMQPGVFNVAIGLSGEMNNAWTAVAYEKLELASGQHITGKDFHLISGVLITGKAVDAGTKKPFAGLSIGVYGPAHPQSGAWVQNTKTGIDGTYRLLVPAGDQYVYLQSAVPDGYQSPQPSAKNITVNETQSATVDFAFPHDPNPPLTGRVVDAAGKPVPQAFITMERPDPSMPKPDYDELKTSDDQGRFAFAAVPPKSTLRAFKGHAGTFKPVLVGKDTRDLTLTIEDGYLTDITGVVTDSAGKPIGGAMVSLIQQHGSFGTGTMPMPADEQGRYHFDDLPIDAKYNVSAFATGYGDANVDVHLKPGNANELPAITLASATSFIAGHVIDSLGRPAAGVTVYLMTRQSDHPTVTTDATGAFRFGGVVPGERMTVYTMRDGGRKIGDSASANAGTTDAVLRNPATRPTQ